MSLFARAQAALLGVIVFVAFTQVGVHIGEERNARNDALNATVRELMRFVSNAHGAPFVRPVRADLLGDKAFERKLEGDDEYYGEDEDETPADFGATMLGLGLAGEDDDPYAASETALTDDVVGFYDSSEERLYVRGKAITPYTKLVLVHELAHAWQDQHFDLDEVQDVENPDAFTAADALVEGDAVRIETMWRNAQSAADRAAIDAAEGDGPAGSGEGMSKAEVSLAILYDFPYAAGEEFATEVYRRGGNDALSRAFRKPPTSTEQVLHPEKYFAGEEADRVPEPDADGEAVDKGVLGELGLLMVVMNGTWDDDAFDAVEGWAGDRYVTWEGADELCTEVHVRMDSGAARDRLAKALRAKASSDATVATNGTAGVDLKYCTDA